MSELQSTRPVTLTNLRTAQPATSRLPWWLQVIVLLGAILNPAMLLSPHDEINAAVHIYAEYVFSRNATLAVLLVASMLFRSKGTLNT
ncbi:MAG TPA: hypothetical protein VIX91_09735 [Candidatus Acidoferrum sp.]